MSHVNSWDGAVQAIRRDFDDAFSRPVADPVGPGQELLSVKAHDLHHLIALRDVAVIRPCPTIARLPRELPTLVGLAMVEGVFVAVHDLAALLRPGSTARPRPWLLVARQDREMAFAVDSVEGLLHVADDQWARRADASPLVNRALIDGPVLKTLVDLGAAIAVVRRSLAGPGG